MITTLDDFLRRRSKIALVVSRAVMRRSGGLKEACALFFGNQEAENQWQSYFGERVLSGPDNNPGSALTDVA
jgi:glycerol-3-phosphate dehydrogenase